MDDIKVIKQVIAQAAHDAAKAVVLATSEEGRRQSIHSEAN